MRLSGLTRQWLGLFSILFLAFGQVALATPYTTTVPSTGVELPDEYPEAGGVAIVLTGANGNIYYQFSDPSGAFRGFNYSGQPAAFRGNPFTINSPLALDCGYSSCATYFGGSIARIDIRFSAYDGDTQPNGFDENDISLRINGFNVGSWSGIQTEITNNNGRNSFGFTTGFGNNTFNTAWFSSTNSALLSNILTTGQTSTQVFDDDPNDNYWDFRRGPTLPDEDFRTVAPGYELDKTIVGGATTFTQAGEVLTYEYKVSNIGSVDIEDITVVDDRIPNVMCPAPPNNFLMRTNDGAAQPNALTCTGTYTVTQADVDAGTLTNIAEANGTPEFGELGVLTDQVTLTGPTLNNAMTLVKTANVGSFSTVDEIISYTFTVTNTGNSTLTNVSVTDPLIPGLSCSIPEILPLSIANSDNTGSCVGTYQVTQNDVDDFAINGAKLVNNAAASATAPDGSTEQATASHSLDGPTAAPSLTIEKTAIQSSFDADGETLDFLIKVTNTGSVTWPNPPAITDALTGGASCPSGTVATGASVTCTASYAVDQDDLDVGSVTNTASADITVGGQSATGTDDVTVNAVVQPALSIVKQLQAGSPDPYSAIGDIIVYEYILTNDSNVTLSSPTITDDRISATCPSGDIAPGGSVTCTSANYVIDQDDLNDGSVVNTASGTANLPQGGTVTSPDAVVTVAADQNPSMQMVKTAPTVDSLTFAEGLVVTYTYDITNNGNVTLDGPINVVDDKINGGAPFFCAAGPILPTAGVQCSADYTVTAADEQSAFVTNNAYGTNGTTDSNTDNATIPESGTPGITIDKTAVTADFDATSDTLTFGFTIRNTGTVNITQTNNSISINDPGVTLSGCTQPATLYPEGSVNTPTSYSCTGTFTGLTQGDLDAGEFTNTASASFPFQPSGGPQITVTSSPSDATVPANITPAFTIAKVSTDDYANVNDPVNYTFTVTNQSSQSLSQVVVTDPLIPGLSCTLTNIPGFGNDSCSGTYLVTQEDLDAGQVDNTATATATTPLGIVLTETADETVAIDPAAQTRILSLEKDATETAFAAVGDIINYTLTVTNDGNLTATNVIIEDPAIGVNCVIPSLAPTLSDNSCTGSRAVTQADIDAGSYTNNATARADGISPVSASETVNGPARVASWDFSKSADTSFSAVGDNVRFTLRIENTGNVTLTNVVLTDTFFDPDVICNIGDLAPGAVDNSCEGTYVIQQSEMDAGSISNMASFAGNGVNGSAESDTADVTVPGPTRDPSLTVTKVEEDGNNGYVLNTPEFYTFAIENTGNVTLTNVQFTDPLTNLTCTLADLEPGDIATTCDSPAGPLRASYTPDQDDIDAGSLTNVATVTADTPSGLPSLSETGTLTLTGPDQLPLISMVKTPTGGANFDTVGDEITYNYVVTNDGNITIDAPITVVDDKTTVSCPTADILPGASLTCTASYFVTQTDLNNGEVVNLATASVSQPVVPSPTHPTGTADVSSAQETATVTADQQPELSIIKRIRPGTPTTYEGAGDLADAGNANNLIFEFLVTNEGNVTTTSPITINDTQIPSNITCESGPVAPGAQVVCSAVWAPEQSDIDNGSFTNSATASTEFDGNTITTPTPGTATAFAIQRPELTVGKSLVSVTNNTFGPMQTATYSFEVTNTGNTTITAPISVTDNLIGTFNCGNTNLAPMDSTTCTNTYQITNDDFALGSVTNIATASNGTTTSAPTSETIPNNLNPAIALDKRAEPAPTATKAGDTIQYVFEITNTSPGNGTLRPDLGPAFTIEDDKIGTINCNSGPALGPDASFTCNASYLVTQADVDAISGTGVDGFVTNNATAMTTFGSQDVISPPDQVTVTLAADPKLDVVKVATNLTDSGQPADEGDTLNFQITVSNTGNQTISNVLVTDPMLSGLSCTGGGSDPNNLTIAPTEQIVCNGTYVVQQSDLDDQSITNTATAEGSSQQGQIVSDDGSTSYSVASPNPVLTVEKDLVLTASPSPFTDVGQTVSFVITVKNMGNITVNGITVTDSLIPGSCSIGTLAPDEEDATCVFDYVVQQTDIDNGQIDNTATAMGAPETGGTVSGSGVESVVGPAKTPAIGISKSGVGPLADGGFDAPLQTISYVYTIANLGNVTLTEVPTITDDRIATADITCDPMPVGGLLPTEEIQCVATDVTDQDDVDAGLVTNNATVTMPNEYDPSGPDLTASIQETVAGERTTGLTITKVASDTSNVTEQTDITYTYTVTNTGNVRLANVTLDDQHTNAAGTSALPITGSPIAVMQPDEVVILTATYDVTQADIDAGVPLTNEVTASATSPTGTTVDDATASESVSIIAPDGMMDVIKTLPVTPAVLEPNVDLVFQVTVKNTGNVTLTAPTLVDSVTQVGAAAPLPTNPMAVFQSSDVNNDADLDVGETWTYSVTYTLTQSDIDAGGIQNSVVATANDPSGTSVTDTSDNGAGDGDDPTVVPIAPAGALTVLKTVRSSPAVPAPGLSVIYEVTVENTGNVTLSTPALVDTLERADGATVTPAPSAIYETGNAAPTATLEVGETWTYRVEHVLTQADMDAGGLSNSVKATATDPSGTTVEDTSDNGAGSGDDPTPFAITPDPSLVAVKTVSGPVPATPQVNDIVQFEVAIENTGNVSLTAPVLTDTLTPNGGSAVSPAPVPAFDSGDTNNDALLSVGETWVYVLAYPVTQVDIDAGGFSNSVFAEADDPNGTTVNDTSDNGAGGGSDPTPVILNQDPKIEAVKTILNNPIVANDLVQFEILVTNTGNVTLTSVDIATDTLTRGTGPTVLPLTSGPDFISSNNGSAEGTLRAGETARYRATYVLQQEDIDAGGISNTATATGTPPSGGAITDVTDNGTGSGADPTTLSIPADPSMDLVKTLVSGGPTFDAVNDVLAYEFEVTNTGNVTLVAPITIDDPLIDNAGGSVSCPAVDLLPDASLTCLGSYSVMQGDIDAGEVENTATAVNGTTVSDPSSVTTLAQQNPAIETLKEGVSIATGGVTYPGLPSERFVIGAVVTYNYTVTNTGNTTITDSITVSDNQISSVSCPALPTGGLLPTDNIVCTATYTVTVDDVALTSVTNIASATDGTTTSPVVSETVPASGTPSLGILKDLVSVTNPAGDVQAGLDYDEVGDVLTYSFAVTNTGQVSFANPVTVEDSRIASPIACYTPDASNPDLIPGETVTCTATYTVAQDDLDAETVTNSAFAGTTFGTDGQVFSDPAFETANVNAAPSIVLSKAVATLPVTAVDQVLTYTLVAENTGNQTLRQVIVTDPLLPDLSCEIAELAPRVTLSCSDTYVVTQDDIDAGELVNTADITALSPNDTVIDNTTSVTTDMPAAAPGVALKKFASIEPFGAAGSTIEYSFAVQNTGNVTLTNVVVIDSIVSPAYSCNIPTVAVGTTDNTTCILSYTVQQADVDAGEILNTADVVATDPFGTVVDASDSLATQGTAAAPQLTATKMSELIGDGTAGSILRYTLSVLNSGNVTLSITGITDTMTRQDGTPVTLDAPFTFVSGDQNSDTRLNLSETWVYTADYTLTQDDLDAGGVANTATVAATAPDGTPVSDISDDGIDTETNSVDDPTIFLITPEPSLVVVKSVRSTGVLAGDEIIFDIAVRNDGNVTLRNLALEDTMLDGAGTDVSAGVSAPVLLTTPITAGELAPTEEWLYEVRYTLTQSDIDAGGLANSVTAQATAPNGITTNDVSDSGDPADGAGDDDLTRVVIPSAPAMEVSKLASTPIRRGEGIFDIDFTLQIENTGNVTLGDLSMVDDLAAFATPATIVSVSLPTDSGFATGGANPDFDGQADTETLQIGSTILPGVTAMVNFTVRLDIATGTTTNENLIAVTTDKIVGGVLGAAPVGPMIEPDLNVSKTVSPTTAIAGDVVTYIINVANGNAATEGGLTIVDEMPAGLLYVDGSAAVNGVPTVPTVDGRTLRWEEVEIAGASDTTVTLQARVLDGAGALTNQAWVAASDGTVLSNVAAATLQVRPEAVFHCGDVIGRVFDDRNANGYQDGAYPTLRDPRLTDQTYFGGKFANPPQDAPDAEPGLPGARLATVDGDVITTDAFGRFSVPCALLPAGNGSNFVLKLDETSLPSGYHVTSENPRMMRLTPGIMTQMNFGASLADIVEVSLTAAAFDGAAPSAGLLSGIDQLVAQMGTAPTVLRIGYYVNGEGRDLARDRLDVVEHLIRDKWQTSGSGRDLIIERTIAQVQ